MIRLDAKLLARRMRSALCGDGPWQRWRDLAARAKTWTSVTIVTEGGYEPWNMTAPDGAIVGFEPEFMQDLCARMKLTCHIVSQDWDGMIAGLNAGKFDVIMDALAITPDRAQVIAFTVPFARTPAGFVAVKAEALGNLPGTGSVVASSIGRSRYAAPMPWRRCAPPSRGRRSGCRWATR